LYSYESSAFFSSIYMQFAPFLSTFSHKFKLDQKKRFSISLDITGDTSVIVKYKKFSQILRKHGQ
jgi:hypothetical protein